MIHLFSTDALGDGTNFYAEQTNFDCYYVMIYWENEPAIDDDTVAVWHIKPKQNA